MSFLYWIAHCWAYVVDLLKGVVVDRVINCFVSNSNSNFLTLSEIPFSSHHLSKVWIVGMCAADGTNVLHCYSWTAGDIYIYIYVYLS